MGEMMWDSAQNVNDKYVQRHKEVWVGPRAGAGGLI